MKTLEKDPRQIGVPFFNQGNNVDGSHLIWGTSNSSGLYGKNSIYSSSNTKLQKYSHPGDPHHHRSQSPIQSNQFQANAHYSSNQSPSKGRSISQGRIATNVYRSSELTGITPNLHIHNEYDPRFRVPYGQAKQVTRGTDEKKYKEKLAEALSQRNRPRSGLVYPKPNETRAQNPTHKKSNSTAFQSSKAGYRSGSQPDKRGNLGVSVNETIQQNFWVSASNPYSRQRHPQNTVQWASGPELHIEASHRSNQTPLPNRKDSENLVAAGKIHSSTYRSLISPIDLKNLSHNEGLLSGHGHKSSAFSTGSRILNILKTPPAYTNAFLSSTPGKLSSSPTRNSPASFRISTDSYSVTNRKRSVQDLMGQSQQKLEDSVLLSKRAEEYGKDNTVSGQSSYRVVSPDSKNRYMSTYRPSFGSNITGRASAKDTARPADPSTYQVVVEHYSDSTKYEGEKYQGKRQGKGTFSYKEGYKFEGDWQDDAMNGFGILWFDQKTKIYEGEWQNNLFHGRGTLFNHEIKLNANFEGTNFKQLRGGWTKFEGVFNSGKKEGFGTLFIANGDVFVGSFARDVVHGRGSYTLKNGQKFIGLWRENILIQKF